MARTTVPRKGVANGVGVSPGATAEVKPAPAATKTAPTSARPSSEQVRVRAFEIYQSRCRAGKPGDAASDWAQAERELMQAAR